MFWPLWAAACVRFDNQLACLHFESSKGPAEQLLLFGELSPDMLRVSSHCQDEESSASWRFSRKQSGDTVAPMEMDALFDMDVLMSEFSDTLFSTLASHQPISWPNPREIGEIGDIDWRDYCHGILEILLKPNQSGQSTNGQESILNCKGKSHKYFSINTGITDNKFWVISQKGLGSLMFPGFLPY